jgi:hypothetical protein
MIETFKIVSGIYDPVAAPQLARADQLERRTRGNQCKLFKNRCITTFRQGFFTQRIIDKWNSLPDRVVTAPSVPAFERRLDKHWANVEFKHDWEANVLSEILRSAGRETNTTEDPDLDT